MASSCPTIADATSRCTASATRWNSSGSSGVGSASAPAIAALSMGMLMDVLTNDLTLAASIEHAHGIAVVVGHEDAVRALVHRQGIGATAHANSAQALPGARVEHAHVVVSLVGDEDEAAFLVHRQRKGCKAHGDRAQDGPTACIEHAHAAATGDAALAGGTSSVGDEDAAGRLVDG